MRRVLRAVTLGRDPGDISTIEDEGSVSEARQAWEDMRREIGHHPEEGLEALPNGVAEPAAD